jgi:methyl-accepting chemotaxis protein
VFDSIQKRLLFYILSITTLFLLGISILNYLWAEKAVVDLSEQRTTALVDAAAARIEGYLLQKGQNAWTLAQNEQIHRFVQKISSQNLDLSQDNDYKEMMTSFQRIVNSNPDIKFVYVAVDKTDRLYGNMEFKYPPGYKVSDRPWYKEAAQKRTLVYTAPYVCPLTGNYVVTAAVPFYSNNGELLGVAAVDILVKRIEDIVNNIQVYKTGYAFMLDDKGVAITHPDDSYNKKSLLKQKDLDPDLAVIAGKMIEGEKGLDTATIDKIPSYVIYRPISETRWSIGAIVPIDEVRESLYTLGRISLFTVLIGIFVITLIVIMWTSRITQPINEFTNLMHEVEEGNYTVRAKIHNRDEVGRLANSLNHMLEKQQQLISQLITMAYKMSLTGHELAIAMGEARTTLPVVTAELGKLMDKQYLTTVDKSDLWGQNPNHEFMDTLININYINRSVCASIEQIQSALDKESENTGSDTAKISVEARAELDRISCQMQKLCHMTEDLQIDYVELTAGITSTAKYLTDMINTMQIVRSKITRILAIQYESINSATATSKELVKWSQTLLQLTACFHIKPGSGEESNMGSDDLKMIEGADEGKGEDQS